MVWSRGSTSCICVWMSSCLRTVLPLPSGLDMLVRSVVYECVSSLLDSVLLPWSTCPFSCHYHTVLVIRALSKSWNQEVWVPQICSFSKLFWLFESICIFVCILKITTPQPCWKVGSWNFDKNFLFFIEVKFKQRKVSHFKVKNSLALSTSA